MKWTLDEIKEFGSLMDKQASRKQMYRIEARLAFPGFIKTHGQEKCDAMFEYLKSHNWVPGVPDGNA